MNQNQLNPFNDFTGSDRVKSPLVIFSILFGLVGLAFVVTKAGLIAIFALILLPAIFIYLFILFRFPVIGLYSAIVAGYLLLGIGRYVTGVQVGLGMDALLLLTFLAIFIKHFYDGIDWSPAKKDIMLLAALWMCYAIFQLVNPEAQSTAAWFSGRGIALYMFLLVPLTLMLVNTNQKLDVVFYTWGFFSILATLKGLMQNFIGVDPWEQEWLNIEGNRTTHILFGKLRVFSFLSDAGQFGANQGYSAVVAAILAIGLKDWPKKIFFIIVALLGFYGLIISGTRGALSVPLAAFALYFILKKNIWIMGTGFVFLLGFVVFFKFTTIGQDNPEIRRMRSAFDPNNPSLLVRKENQKKFKAYLATRPFGGGIGHAGSKARRFVPNSFLSHTATDSWYVLIWAEQGVVGLMLHLFILFYIIIKASWNIMFRIVNPLVKLKMMALTSGMFGIMVASYGNAVLGQMPTSILIYTSMALILNSKVFDSEYQGRVSELDNTKNSFLTDASIPVTNSTNK
jgi:hypothetical protein